MKLTVQGRLGEGWHPPPPVTLTVGGRLAAGVASGVGVGVGVGAGAGVGIATGGDGAVGLPSHDERTAVETISAAACLILLTALIPTSVGPRYSKRPANEAAGAVVGSG